MSTSCPQEISQALENLLAVGDVPPNTSISLSTSTVYVFNLPQFKLGLSGLVLESTSENFAKLWRKLCDSKAEAALCSGGTVHC